MNLALNPHAWTAELLSSRVLAVSAEMKFINKSQTELEGFKFLKLFNSKLFKFLSKYLELLNCMRLEKVPAGLVRERRHGS